MMTIELTRDNVPFYEVDGFVKDAISKAFGALLNNCHLYQSVEVPAGELQKRIVDHPYADNYRQSAWEMVNKRDWILISHYGEAPVTPAIVIKIPVIRTYCNKCEGVFPFNATPKVTQINLWEGRQEFTVLLQCQNCRDGLVTFLVSRSSGKVVLTGRSPIETVSVPPVVPKTVAQHYSSAMLASNCNQILPALFMLRTLIEQHMRSKVSSQAERGDDLCKAYKDTLPADFKERFPTLADTYDRLSEALHEAKADEGLFNRELEKIHEHFAARKLFKLDEVSRKK
jgi:hypothetical protein